MSKLKRLLTITIASSSILMAGCATYRPVLYDNAKYQQVGEAAAERDVDACLAKADQYLEKHKSERMGKEAGRGAVGGAIMGGIFGALTGRGLKGAAVGAGVGAGVGAASAAGGVAAQDKLTPDRMKQNYVSRCLGEKGYEVMGWK